MDSARPFPEPEPSASVADWSREHKPFWAWMPSRSLLASIRAYQRIAGSRLPWHALRRRWLVLTHRFWSVITGADIPLGCSIGGGLLLPHPNGVVIHNDVEIGPNCLIFQQVTLGARRGRVPRIGGHVDISAGAKLLGGIVVGDDAVIGANAVVLDDVPPGATVVGIPGMVVASHGGRPR
jgi:serine O-acetyltransferase